MNKQEVINQIKKFSELDPNYPCAINRTPNVIHAIEQLDEPQKVKVPAFVAEWIETAKKEKRTLHYSMQDIDDACYYHKGDDPLYQWMFVCGDSSEHQETFARAYMDGYEVEEEPKWIVRIGKVYLTGNQSYSFYKEDATPFEIEKFAEEAAEKTGGTVEKV